MKQIHIDILNHIMKRTREQAAHWKYGRESHTAQYSDDYCQEQEDRCNAEADAIQAALSQ